MAEDFHVRREAIAEERFQRHRPRSVFIHLDDRRIPTTFMLERREESDMRKADVSDEKCREKTVGVARLIAQEHVTDFELRAAVCDAPLALLVRFNSEF